MSAINTEIAYLEYRLAITISQRDGASGGCSRASHNGLVELYRYRLAVLRAYDPGVMPIDPPIEQAHEAGAFGRDFGASPKSPNVREFEQPIAGKARAVAYA